MNVSQALEYERQPFYSHVYLWRHGAMGRAPEG